MSKTYIRTCDIFNIKDKSIRQQYFDHCYRKALKSGLICRVHMDEKHFEVLDLSGSKYQFVKYYLSTMLKTTNKANGVKRLISVIFT